MPWLARNHVWTSGRNICDSGWPYCPMATRVGEDPIILFQVIRSSLLILARFSLFSLVLTSPIPYALLVTVLTGLMTFPGFFGSYMSVSIFGPCCDESFPQSFPRLMQLFFLSPCRKDTSHC